MKLNKINYYIINNNQILNYKMLKMMNLLQNIIQIMMECYNKILFKKIKIYN